MYRSEMFKEHWATLIPKIWELWSNLTEQEVQGINGDVELLVKKVSAKYGIDREEILSKLASRLAGFGREGHRRSC